MMSLNRRITNLEQHTASGQRPQLHRAFVGAGETNVEADPPRFATEAAFDAWREQLPPADTVVAYDADTPDPDY